MHKEIVGEGLARRSQKLGGLSDLVEQEYEHNQAEIHYSAVRWSHSYDAGMQSILSVPHAWNLVLAGCTVVSSERRKSNISFWSSLIHQLIQGLGIFTSSSYTFFWELSLHLQMGKYSGSGRSLKCIALLFTFPWLISVSWCSQLLEKRGGLLVFPEGGENRNIGEYSQFAVNGFQIFWIHQYEVIIFISVFYIHPHTQNLEKLILVPFIHDAFYCFFCSVKSPRIIWKYCASVNWLFNEKKGIILVVGLNALSH